MGIQLVVIPFSQICNRSVLLPLFKEGWRELNVQQAVEKMILPDWHAGNGY